MTKGEFIDLIKKRLPEQMEIHGRTIELSISSIFSDLVFSRSKSAEIDQFAKYYPDNEVKQDESGRFYCDLPVKITPTPMAMGSVRRVFSQQEDDIIFVLIHPVRTRLIKHDEAFRVINAIPYYLRDGNKVIFATKNMKGIESVDMNIVPEFDSYDYSETVRMPGGQEWNIIKEIVALLVGTPEKDKAND